MKKKIQKKESQTNRKKKKPETFKPPTKEEMKEREKKAEERAKENREREKAAQDKRDEIEAKIEKAGGDCFTDKSKSLKEKRECANKKARDAASQVSGKNLTDVDLKKLQQDAGRKKGVAIVNNCTANAPDKKARMAFYKSKDAKDECFKSNGGFTCTDTDLMEGLEEEATEKVKSEISKCAELDNTKEKKKCLSGKAKDIKSILASAGEDAEKLKDSDVKEYIRRGAEKAIASSISVCNSTDLKTCYDDAKKAYKDTSGSENISDYDFERAANRAKKAQLVKDMEACKRDAGSDKQKLTDCRKKTAAASMKKFSLDGKQPSTTEVDNFLQEAATEAIKKAKSACRKTSSKSECDAQAADIIAATKGKDAKDVTKFERREVEEKAAISSTLDNARDCLKARKDNASATCKDPYDVYKEVTSKAEPKTEKDMKVAKEKLKAAALKDAAKESRKACLEKATKEEVTACLMQAKTDEDEVSGILFPEVSEKVREKKREMAEKEANVEVLGSVFGACMKEAGDDKSKKDACLSELKDKKDKLGEAEDTKKILKRARTNLLIEPAEACDGSDLKSCREAAKAAAKDAGMPEKEYAQTKKLAEVKGAAKVWAACSESGNEDSECDDMAKQKFVEISGSAAGAYEEKPTPDAKQTVKERVKKMGKAIKDGKETKLIEKKKLVITIVTSGTKCDKNVNVEFKEAVEKLRESASATVEQKKILGVAKPSCRLVDGLAEYNTVADTKDLNTTDEYDKVTTDTGSSLSSLKYKTTSRRRLLLAEVSTTNSYAAREVTECVADDTECQSDNSIEMDNNDDDENSKEKEDTMGTSGSVSLGSRSILNTMSCFIGLMIFSVLM